MEHDEEGEARWPIDLEATVAKNVRRLREGRGLSQQQLGTDLFLHGVGMHQTTVAKLEAGSKPLRLNEVAAIAAYFEVSIESLWEESGKILDEHEVAVLLRNIAHLEVALRDSREAVAQADEQVMRAHAEVSSAMANRSAAAEVQRTLAARLADLEQRGRTAAQAALEKGLSHGEH